MKNLIVMNMREYEAIGAMFIKIHNLLLELSYDPATERAKKHKDEAYNNFVFKYKRHDDVIVFNKDVYDDIITSLLNIRSPYMVHDRGEDDLVNDLFKLVKCTYDAMTLYAPASQYD